MNFERKYQFVSLAILGLLASGIGSQAAGIWDGVPVPNPNGNAPAGLAAAVDARVIETLRGSNFTGLTVAITKAGRLVYDRGFGYANWGGQDADDLGHACAHRQHHQGSRGAAMMALTDETPGLTLSSPVYGPEGVLNGSDYKAAYRQGNRRHYPVLGIAIGQNNRVISWYIDGKFTVGDT